MRLMFLSASAYEDGWSLSSSCYCWERAVTKDQVLGRSYEGRILYTLKFAHILQAGRN